MNLLVVGCSHHQASVSMREQLAFSHSQIGPFLDLFYDRYPDSEAVLLSTCNRTEFYAAASKPELIPSRSEMVELLANQSGLLQSELDAGIFSFTDRGAVKHLFSVAASLDSMVIGETQILAQVKRAYQLAVEKNEAMPVSHQAFQAAIRVARRVSNETSIHANRVSVPSVAICSLAKQIFERLNNKKILVIGAGEMAEESLTYILSEGGRDIVIANRTFESSQDLAKRCNGRVARWEDLEEELTQADLIVSTTGSTEPVVTGEIFQRIETKRNQNPMFILDLAVPRDFDENIGDYPNVYLYSLDDVQKQCLRNQKTRESQFPEALRIIEQETELFFADQRRRSSGTAIAMLKQKATETKEAELTRLMNRLEGVSTEHRLEIEKSFHRLVNKILHPPLESLQDDTAKGSKHGLLDAIKKLFQLGE
ncbi:MAG: glutamyl-tRNA reductase [Planctomycetota bacterium]